MKRLFLILALINWTALYAQDSSKACYKKAELQRIAYRIMYAQYCDSVLPVYEEMIENMEEDLAKANKQLIIQDERYGNMEYLFTTCATERQVLAREKEKLHRKVRRNRVLTGLACGIGAIGWLLVLL